MKKVLKNKKGFTLVELLAVIVILALLIIITANTILPMLGRTKQTAMTTYAKRVLNNALTNLEADKVTKGDFEDGDEEVYRIYEDLTKNESYYGCVTVKNDEGTYKYSITMYSEKDDLQMTVDEIEDITDLGEVSFSPYTNDDAREDVEDAC